MNLLSTSNPEWEVPKSGNKGMKKDSLFFISLLQIMVNPFFIFATILCIILHQVRCMENMDLVKSL